MIRSAASQFRWANLLTYVGVSGSVVGMALTDGPDTRSWAGAGIAIAIACDLFDGRFARLFRRTEDDKRFGVEIDSLADVISFGLVPPLCMLKVASAATPAERAILLSAGVVYVLCIATRLAHFNVFQAGTGGFCAILLLWVPGPALTATVLVFGGAAAVGGFRIPRPGPVVLYTLLGISVTAAGAHVFRLLAR